MSRVFGAAMKCPECDVTWSAFELGRVCWSCGREIPKPPPSNANAQYVFPGDTSRVRAGERG